MAKNQFTTKIIKSNKINKKKRCKKGQFLGIKVI